MIRMIGLALLLGLLFAPSFAKADWWTQGQADAARHNFRHGRWDCYGRCLPEPRRHRHRHHR